MTPKGYKVGYLRDDGEVEWFSNGSYSWCENIVSYNEYLDHEDGECTKYFIEPIDNSSNVCL